MLTYRMNSVSGGVRKRSNDVIAVFGSSFAGIAEILEQGLRQKEGVSVTVVTSLDRGTYLWDRLYE